MCEGWSCYEVSMARYVHPFFYQSAVELDGCDAPPFLLVWLCIEIFNTMPAKTQSAVSGY